MAALYRTQSNGAISVFTDFALIPSSIIATTPISVLAELFLPALALLKDIQTSSIEKDGRVDDDCYDRCCVSS